MYKACIRHQQCNVECEISFHGHPNTTEDFLSKTITFLVSALCVPYVFVFDASTSAKFFHSFCATGAYDNCLHVWPPCARFANEHTDTNIHAEHKAYTPSEYNLRYVCQCLYNYAFAYRVGVCACVLYTREIRQEADAVQRNRGDITGGNICTETEIHNHICCRYVPRVNLLLPYPPILLCARLYAIVASIRLVFWWSAHSYMGQTVCRLNATFTRHTHSRLDFEVDPKHNEVKIEQRLARNKMCHWRHTHTNIQSYGAVQMVRRVSFAERRWTGRQNFCYRERFPGKKYSIRDAFFSLTIHFCSHSQSERTVGRIL